MTSKNCYELLEVAPTASPTEIKQAFRRAIAKYHPDKVQHLGVELQEIAAVRAAEITQAYRTLYVAPFRDSHTSTGALEFRSQDAVSRGDRDEVRRLVRRAALTRVRNALREDGWLGEQASPPFDLGATSLTKWGQKGWRIIGRVGVELSDATVQETWAAAQRLHRGDSRRLCALLMGRSASSSGQPRNAVSRARATGFNGSEPSVVLIAIDVNTWHADVPNGTPPLLTALLRRLSA